MSLTIIISIHIIGAIISVIIDMKDGTFEDALKHGDGIRTERPADVLFWDLFLWEISFFLLILGLISLLIDYVFAKIYEKDN